MNLTDKNFLILIICAVFILATLIYLPFRTKFILKNAGKLILKTKNSSKITSGLVLIFSGILIIVSARRELSFFATIIVYALSVLGCFMGTGEILLCAKSGLYENGIISGGRFYSLSSFKNLPMLKLPEEDQNFYKNNSIKIITNNNNTISIQFFNDEEASAVQNELIKLKPELKD